ncbi:MAG: M23 family peptidase [Deltaproteobacteria bacterium]|nr:M23 family peptidase [Deltaproteobacteria bacterium]
MEADKIPEGKFKRKRQRYFLYLFASLMGIILVIAFFRPSPPDKLKPAKTQEPLALPPALPPDKIHSGQVGKGDTLSSILRSRNLPPAMVEAICQKLNSLINLRKMKPGDSFEVRLTPDGQFLSFFYQTSPIDIYQITAQPSGEWQSRKKEVPVEKYWARISGEISTSLFEAMDALSEHDQLVLDFAGIFASEIDFHSDPKPADRFQIVVEKYYTGNTFVKYGRTLYAAYQSGSKAHQAIFFPGSGKEGGYYNFGGESLRKLFLRSPLQFNRITSGYSKSRRHPILGGYRPHYGIDYAAPKGSPVWAVADGKVSFCGWNGGYGNQVIINHRDGYKSMYGHLSRFAPGIKNGTAVRQKQLIGYVGSTGLSTGPHLDFRLMKNNVFRNPLREISPRASSLRKDQIADFERTKELLLAWMNEFSPEKYRKVADLTSRDLEPLKDDKTKPRRPKPRPGRDRRG